MSDTLFHYDSRRAEEARVSVWLSPSWRFLLGFVAVGAFIAGIVLLFLAVPIGWLVSGLAVVPVLVLEWWQGKLKQLALAPQPTTIDDLLEGNVLGRIPKNPSPRQIATIAASVPSGQFLAARFGIGGRFLQDITSDDPTTTEAVWRETLAIREQVGSPSIPGAIVVVALIKQFPQYETLLAHLQLSSEDLYAGIRWYDHVRQLIDRHGAPQRTGGIARDWSFGYIPLLTRFGQNISAQLSGGGLLTAELEAHTKALEQMVELFGHGGRQNVALVGPAGVGKTTIVQAFARKLLDAKANIPESLKFRQVFMLDAASLIAAAPGRGELEQLIMRVLGEAYSAKNIIVCLDNAQLFFEEGIGSVDVSNVLLPILEAGRLRLILTMEEQRLLQISSRNPALANALNRVNVGAASRDETMAVMQDQLIVTEFRQHVTYMYQSLQEAYRLSERYIHDLAMPGRALKLLEAAAGYAESGLVSAKSVQQAIEQTVGIKVGVADSEQERDRLLHLEELIHRRMINQSRAVSVVSDALRRARAGVRNQDRPIGTFLFLGPTGVGKTELAKALADVYFGGENRMIRLDMNEFVRPEDVSRLIADGANDPNSLTAQAMKQPFSVVLLDEIEKAHPQVLSTLLQLLDEGILRDEKNREVSFRDAIVIATSNAGADRIREYIERGYQLEQFEQQFIDELINSNQFRPEFLNRFDEIVTFRPLDKAELIQVVDLILAGINKNLSLQRVSVTVSDEAKHYLVEQGYDPRLGARPMRRVVQKAVENTVAKQMLGGLVAPGTVVTIDLGQVQAILGSQHHAQQLADELK